VSSWPLRGQIGIVYSKKYKALGLPLALTNGMIDDWLNMCRSASLVLEVVAGEDADTPRNRKLNPRNCVQIRY